MKQIKTSILFLLLAMLSACNGNNKEEIEANSSSSISNIDQVLPIFMKNEANTKLYKEASTNSKIISTVPEEGTLSIIGLTAIKDAENRVWYKCYYPKEHLEGWTLQASHSNFKEEERYLPFLQNITLANLQMGANPRDAKRLLGKPKLESSETGPLETSGYIDEDYIVTTTTMEYDGIHLIFQDENMIHADISKAGKSFGWITCKDKEWNKDFIMKKFKLTDENFYDDGEGMKTISVYWDILSLTIFLDAADLVESIKFHYGS